MFIKKRKYNDLLKKLEETTAKNEYYQKTIDNILAEYERSVYENQKIIATLESKLDKKVKRTKKSDEKC